MSLEAELQTVTNVRKVGRTEQQYLRAIAKALDQLEDDEWDKLSKEAQDWSNSAMQAIQNDQPLPEFVPEQSEQDLELESSNGSKRGKPHSGVKIRIKELLLNDINMSREDIARSLKKDGYPVSLTTIRAMRSEFRHTMKFLVKKGVLNIEVKF